jgi:hypothetical protein
MNKKKKDNYYVLWSGMIVLCIVLVLFSLIFVSCSPESRPQTNAVATENTSGEDVDRHDACTSESPTLLCRNDGKNQTVLLRRRYGQEYVDKFVFLGDSTSMGSVITEYTDVPDLDAHQRTWTCPWSSRPYPILTRRRDYDVMLSR